MDYALLSNGKTKEVTISVPVESRKYMLQMLVWNLYFYVAIIRKYLFLSY